eukprot:TRINITY_DN31170_c0_g1_i1.p1 TRINITY_DN31170_c0_g1~~TRINITY_DN31170_c0_g1_i1.p1  ORF type:complete len:175 (+),score=59.95 TRINITY_DN31170_c0_g1_i1:59-526(+)
MSFYDLKEMGAEGRPVYFSKFKGKVVYGVNVASKCGHTCREYALLNEIAGKFGDSVAIVAFPCSQFGNQELASNREVAAFAKKTGPPGMVVLAKGDVKGPQARPTYKLLSSSFPEMKIGWNFKGKFLVDGQGQMSLTADPLHDIERLLSQKQALG